MSKLLFSERFQYVTASAAFFTTHNWGFCEYKDNSENLIVNNYAVFAEAAHLKIKAHTLKKRAVEFETKEKMSNFIRNVTLCLSRLPSNELKDSFMKEYVDLYFQLYKDDDKMGFRIDFDVVELNTQKQFY